MRLGWVMLPLLREVCGRLLQLSIPRFRHRPAAMKKTSNQICDKLLRMIAAASQSFFLEANTELDAPRTPNGGPYQINQRRFQVVVTAPMLAAALSA